MRKSSIFLIWILSSSFLISIIPVENYNSDTSNSSNITERSMKSELKPSANKKWTFMVYIAADNNLEKDGINDINEMEKVGSDYNINIVVQIDRINDFDDTNGNWTGARRYYILKDYDGAKINSLFMHDLGEVNMGKGSTLKDFIDWSKEKYPADNYALILWDHGGGALSGVCYDDTSGKDRLSLYEIKSVLVNSHVNLLAFDACVMGNVEVHYRYRDYVDAIVASEANIPLDGFPYDSILNYLKQNPNSNAIQLSEQMVLKYEKSYPTKRPLTLSAFKAFTPLFVECLTNFSNKLKDVAIINKAAITNARIASQKFDHPDYIDLWHFAQEIGPTIGTPAAALQGELVNLQIAHKAHKFGNSHGLSIYFPVNLTRYNSKYADLAFGKDFNWSSFLLKYYTNIGIWEFNDFYENNNVPIDAINVDHGAIYSLIINETDVDIFNVTALIDNVVSIDIYFNHTQGNLDLYLTNPGGAQVASSETTNDNETIRFVVPEDGVYSIKIDSLTDDPYQVYDLVIDPGDDDPYEENDNWGDGPLITPSTLYPNLTCRDSDFYNISAVIGQLINITIDFDYFEGDLDLDLWSGQSPTLMASSNSDLGEENLLFAANYTGHFLIEVVNYSKNLNYSLYAEVTDADDGDEENDIPDSATDLGGYTTKPYLKCMDDDYFNITAGGGIWLNITVIFNDTDGNIDVFLYDPNLELVGRSTSITDNETIFHYISSAIPETYCIKINCSEINLDYTLMVYETAAVVEDALENNDDFNNPYALDIGNSYYDLSAIDWDVFSVTGALGYNLIITVDYNVSEGDIDLYLYDDNLELIGWSTEITNQEKITYAVTATDTYLFLVHNYENNMNYNLFIRQTLIDTGEEPETPPPDSPSIYGYHIGPLFFLIGLYTIVIIRRKKFFRKT